MSKFISAHHKLLLRISLCLLFIVLLGLVGYAGRGVFRSSLLPWYAQHSQTKSLKITYDQEYAKLNNPFEYLGLKVNQTQGSCELDIAIKVHTSISCTYYKGTLKDASLSKQSLNDYSVRAATLEKLLIKYGWQNQNPPSQRQTVASINPTNNWFTVSSINGDQYDQQAVYSKVIGQVDCQIGFDIAKQYSLQADYFCWQTFYYFGSPYGHL